MTRELPGLLPGLASNDGLADKDWDSSEVAAVDRVSTEKREVSRVDERLTEDFDRDDML